MKKYVLIVDPFIHPSLIDALKRNHFELIALFSDFKPADVLEARWAKIRSSFSLVLYENEGYLNVLKKLKNYPILHVVNGYDTGTKISIKIANDLKIKFAIPKSTGRFLANKYLTGKYFKRFDLFPVKQIRVNNKNISKAIEYAINDIGFPLIVKPNISSWSYGFSVCYNESELRAAIDKLVDHHDFLGIYLNDAVIQEKLEGKEIIVNCVSLGNTHFIVAIFRYSFEDSADGIRIIRAAELVDPTESNYAPAIAYTKSLLTTAKISSGMSATEIMLTKKGPCLIELNPRMAGQNAQDLIQYCTHTSQSELLVLSFTDPEKFVHLAENPIKRLNYGKIVFLRNKRKGATLEPAAFDKIKALPSCKQISTHFQMNQELPITIDFSTTIGNILISHSEKSQFDKDYQKILKIEEEYFG